MQSTVGRMHRAMLPCAFWLPLFFVHLRTLADVGVDVGLRVKEMQSAASHHLLMEAAITCTHVHQVAKKFILASCCVAYSKLEPVRPVS